MAENKNAQQVREITDKLEQGIKELFESERFKEYLRTMSKFYNYSFNNTLLIAMQKPEATYVAGYTSWQRNFDRQVMKGEKMCIRDREYISRLTEVFTEVRRVLCPDGTLWLNISDTYAGKGNQGDFVDPKNPNGRNGQAVALNNKVDGCKPKDMIGIPWMLAFALRDTGWYLRNDIIWMKDNPMPESVNCLLYTSTFYVLPAVIALLGSYMICREEQEDTLKSLRLIPVDLSLIHI